MIRQIYNTTSDYVTSPTFLNAITGALVTGGVICLGYSIKFMADIRKMGRREEDKGLKEKLDK